MRLSLTCVAALALGLPAAPLPAAMILFSYSTRLVTSEPSGYMLVGYNPPVLSPLPRDSPGMLFGDNTVSAADSGKTFTATDGSPGFSLFAQKLTDGVNEQFAVTYSYSNGGVGMVADESTFVFGTPPLGALDPRIDLHGDTVSSATLTINGFTVDSITDPESGPRTVYDIDVTVSAYGTGPVVGSIPEPSSLGPVALALALLRTRSRRHQTYRPRSLRTSS